MEFESHDGATHSVTTDDLFPAAFMREHTDFDSFDDMTKSSMIVLPEDLEDFGDNQEWCAFVSHRTRFTSWDAMFERAIDDWTGRELGLPDDDEEPSGLGD